MLFRSLVCIAGDISLISLGVGGLGGLIEHHQEVLHVVGGFGTAYLLLMAWRSWQSSRRQGALFLTGETAVTRRSIFLAVLGFTFLNPHVYIDTVLLIGAVGSHFGPERWVFAVGAGTASVVWFCGLSYGATRVSRFVTSENFWRRLDRVVSVVMIAVAMSLLTSMF